MGQFVLWRIKVGKNFILMACASALAFGAVSANADTISNPTNTYSLGNLSGSLTGGNQTQYIGETFTASITGQLTDFQFTLNSSNLQSLYAVVYAWNGTGPGAELWRSATIAGTAGLLDFTPAGVQLTQGQTYVAFLSTFGLSGNSGLATLGDCLPFGGCNSNSIPNLGQAVWGNVQGANLNEVVYTAVSYHDLTFSATITPSAVPEPASWALMVGGLGIVGGMMRGRRRLSARFA
jgi:hypothetical protein